MMLPLVLYDILSELPGNNWSANPAKPSLLRPRFVLSYKELPFVTIWVEYSDISIAMKSIGAKPSKRRNGSDDPNTGFVVADSLAIAEYLDKTYPEKPVIPRGANVLIGLFEPAYCSVAYGKARLELLGETRWEAVSEANVEQQWEDLKKGLDEIDKWYQKSGGKWIMGDTFSFADMVVACRTMWWNKIFDEEQLRELHSWNGGRWARVLADVNAECSTDL
ncbi:hypothetical protein DFJ58DRAFT_716874 [Suillus subalutaceus]|uniref:uncharacterized protein n=1 Tax=Suillus subalutaceus TaxID=48586 RepID=UPI001B876389|nr:uncharacterized protein DFJ58DRAFT_716874 [Suillus subalutaceus]KAG1849933.1 hypothetical protein DFJ58DRAFT_716874 [Suillus subalutaceus]